MKKLSVILLVCASLCACHTSKSTTQVVTQSVHDTLYLNKLQYDSIFIDNVHYIDRSSDTVRIRDICIQYKYKLLQDTVYKSKVDSIPVIKEVTVTQQVKYVPWYTKTLAWIGVVAILLLILLTLKKIYLK